MGFILLFRRRTRAVRLFGWAWYGLDATSPSSRVALRVRGRVSRDALSTRRGSLAPSGSEESHVFVQQNPMATAACDGAGPAWQRGRTLADLARAAVCALTARRAG